MATTFNYAEDTKNLPPPLVSELLGVRVFGYRDAWRVDGVIIMMDDHDVWVIFTPPAPAEVKPRIVGLWFDRQDLHNPGLGFRIEYV